MKILTIFESPLEKIGNTYYAGDPWLTIIQYMASHCDWITLWAPIIEKDDSAKPNEDMWKIDIDNLRIEHHDNYNSYLGFYKLLPFRYRSWKKHAFQLINDHDAVLSRLPSPLLTITTNACSRLNKPLHLTVAGDMLSQSDRIIGNTGLKKLFYKISTIIHVWEEIRCGRKADMIYAYSQDLIDRHQAEEGKVKYMLDTHISLNDIVRREDTCQADEINILRICWLIPSKGIEYLIDAISILVEKGYNVKLNIIGKERIDGYQAELERKCKALQIEDRINFLGWQSFHDTKQAFINNDIQVVSSLSEGTPRVIVEGLSRGIPLVCTTVGGCPILLTNEKNAILIPHSDPDAIANGVEKIIKDGQLRRSLIKNGFTLAESITYENLGVEFLKDIEEMIENHKHK